MPRRPSKINRLNKNKARPVNRSESKIKKWDKLSDIPLDNEDQFHTTRDKILLEGDESDGESDGDEDEVFGLKGMSDEDEDEDEEGYEEPEEDAEGDDNGMDAEKSAPKKKATGKKATSKASEPSESASEEEEAWGRSKSAYYSSNAAQLDSDDEEANELEEQEAKRLQAKARDALGENDFGLGDPVELAAGPTEFDDLSGTHEHNVPSLPRDKQALLRHLEKTNPETLALARDWDDTAWSLVKSQAKLKKLETETPDALSIGMSHLHYQAILTYATTLAFYLHLRSGPRYSENPEALRVHPIMSRLLALKQSIATLEDLDFAPSDEDDDSSIDDDESLSLDGDEEALDREQLWKLDKIEGLEADELTALLADAKSLMPVSSKRQQPPKKKRKVDHEVDPSSNDKKKPGLPVFDLIEPAYKHVKMPSFHASSDMAGVDAYGEATSLQHADQVDKAARKRSLRFHTAKIETKSARRQNARNAMGGDDDIPYRERKKEKEARLARESEKKALTKGQGGVDLDDVEPETAKKKRLRDDDDDGIEANGVDGYYELVERKAKETKEKKKADYEEARGAARPDITDDNAAGPRSLTRAILSNKGLTPHRSKSVRNPRVKKRQKFDKAKKKISSQKAVYKGGIGDTGRYDGEKSGISKVVKSVRLG